MLAGDLKYRNFSPISQCCIYQRLHADVNLDNLPILATNIVLYGFKNMAQ